MNKSVGLRYSRGTRGLLTLLGLGPRRSVVTVTGSELRVRAWPLRLAVPLSAIASAAQERAPWWALFGVHTDSRGRWIVTGAPGPAVRIDLAEPCHGVFAGVRVRVTRLDLGTADDAGLLAALSANRLDDGLVDRLE